MDLSLSVVELIQNLLILDFDLGHLKENQKQKDLQRKLQ
jgi:hypothetical protein